ncbi:protein SMG9 [Contarinia nasturtii]|uniref:protein SMG9 n=1 Tax=Contarinia nasturtii TaxID=265458 RepID=UPI0012D4A876|nr:protein SMG9 [Contarinia nasturtii]
MSENKRNRKSNQNKEPKRPIILAKKSEEKSSATSDKPRILLKPKDTSDQRHNNVTSTTQISIASRPIESGSCNIESSKSRLQSGLTPASSSSSSSTPTTAKDSKESSNTNENATTETKLPSMKKPFLIISDHYQIQSHAQDFLIETNSDFVVVGVIGTQGSGKSFCLNLLNDDEANYDDIAHVNRLIKGETGIFRMRNQMKEMLSNLICTEGIQMYVTKHRTILLDCSAVLCNPYKKEAIFNELDDLKMLIFLLNVCNTVVVVEDCGFNLHLMRLLAMAESMKIDVYENVNDLHERRKHSPNIILFKNKCQNHDFLVENKLRTNNLYRTFFQYSGLKTIPSIRSQEKKSNNEDDDMDVFYFPWIELNEKNHYQAHPDLDIVIAAFRERVFMTPGTPFTVSNQQATVFTEKHWFHLALAVWESYKTSYFLRKFESLKEKEWALRV